GVHRRSDHLPAGPPREWSACRARAGNVLRRSRRPRQRAPRRAGGRGDALSSRCVLSVGFSERARDRCPRRDETVPTARAPPRASLARDRVRSAGRAVPVTTQIEPDATPLTPPDPAALAEPRRKTIP